MLIVHLFVSYAQVNLCHFFFFSSSWCRGLAAASACGSSWTFANAFLYSPNSCYSFIKMTLYITLNWFWLDALSVVGPTGVQLLLDSVAPAFQC